LNYSSFTSFELCFFIDGDDLLALLTLDAEFLPLWCDYDTSFTGSTSRKSKSPCLN
jgi:hypothetical protein